MKKIVHLSLIFSSFLFLSACNEAIKGEAAQTEEPSKDSLSSKKQEPIKEEIQNTKVVKTRQDIIGYWVGMFNPNDGKEEHYILAGEAMAYNYSNKILFSIDSLKDTIVFGHSVVAGNNRPFKGTISSKDNKFILRLKEPGDDKYDGTFACEIAQNEELLKGTWESYKKIETPKRKYELSKKVFAYNPEHLLHKTFIDWNKTKKRTAHPEEDDYYDKTYFATTEDVFKYNASTDKLTPKMVENLTKADIFIIRNAIYAKHGYSFKNRQLRAFFDSHDWYVPLNTDIKADLTTLEKENIELLMRYEKNAAEYYDKFGRG